MKAAHGRVFKYGDNVDTDVIIPARYLNSSDPKELATHCMEDIDKDFVNNVKAGDIMVANKNFGCGSSREHAPIAIKAAGVSCVIAETFARIFYRNAINIGLPIIECPEAAKAINAGDIGSKTYIVDVIDAIKSDNKHVYAMVAPAAEGQFGANITMNSWKKAMQAVGFNGFVEVALGGDMTAAYEADEWLEAYEAGEKKVTSCCPGFVNMVRKHYPELADKISTTVSPMCAVSRMIKAKDPDAVTVFIGPCVAKKSEVHDQKIEGNADYVLTFSEIRAIMKAKGVQLEADDTSYQEGSVFGKRFANSGGVTAAVIESMKEKGEDVDCKVCKANGAAECKKALLLMKAGKLPENFIEGMACEGGCVGGPSSYNDMVTTKKFRDDLLSRADDRKIRDNIANYHMETFEMQRKEQ